MTSSSPPRASRRGAPRASTASRRGSPPRWRARARLEQRHRDDVGGRLGDGEAGERQHAGEVGRRPREAHDARARSLHAQPRLDVGDRAERGEHLAGRGRGPGRSRRRELRSRRGQHARVLPDLHGRQVEAERLDLPAQVLELAPRQARSAARVERALQDVQVAQEGRRSVVRRPWPRCVSRPAGARRARACAGAARRTAFGRARGRRPAAHRRRAPGPGGARGWVARLAPRPRAFARSGATPPPVRAARDRIGSPSPRASPPRSPAGCRRDRRRPRCPNAGTARTTAARDPQPTRRSCGPSRDRPPGAS